MFAHRLLEDFSERSRATARNRMYTAAQSKNCFHSVGGKNAGP
jgi:hypothetical protein